jgi:hypothetical protein
MLHCYTSFVQVGSIVMLEAWNCSKLAVGRWGWTETAHTWGKEVEGFKLQTVNSLEATWSRKSMRFSNANANGTIAPTTERPFNKVPFYGLEIRWHGQLPRHKSLYGWMCLYLSRQLQSVRKGGTATAFDHAKCWAQFQAQRHWEDQSINFVLSRAGSRWEWTSAHLCQSHAIPATNRVRQVV